MAIRSGEAPQDLLVRIGAPLPEDIETIFLTTEARRDAVRADTKYTDKAKAELLAEAEREGHRAFDAAFERLQNAPQRDLDAEEGQARKALLNDPPTLDMTATDGQRHAALVRSVSQHAALTAESNALQLVAVAPDADELARAFDDAEARNQERVMAAAVFRAEAFAKRSRGKANAPIAIDDPTTRIARDLRARLMAFRQAHPSPTDRLRAVAEQRRQRAAALNRSRTHWFRVYGWTDKTPEMRRAEALRTVK